MPHLDIDLGAVPNDGQGDPIRIGGQKINDNFDAAFLAISENYDLIDHDVRQITIPDIDWEQDPMGSISDWINTNGLTVLKNEIVFLRGIELITVPIQGGPSTQFSARYHKWIWNAGSGEYGTILGNTVTVPLWYQISIITGYKKTQYDLGEIGSVPIETEVNGSGPYQVSVAYQTIFLTERSGESHVYLYVGGVNGQIGTGELPTVADDYIDLTAIPPSPIDPNDFVSNAVFNNSLYDTAETGFSTDLSNFTSLTGKFYFLRVQNEGDTVYFASKETNTEDFNGGRIYISASGTKHYLGAPTVTQNGYHFWDLGDLGVPLNAQTGDWAFQAWFHTGKVAKAEILINNQNFRLAKGLGNTGTGIEVGDIAVGGCFHEPTYNQDFFGDLKCIDNTGDLTTGIGTKWEFLNGTQI